MPEILKADGGVSEAAALSRAVEILADGGIIAYPTETFYGLGADATNENAIRKIFDVKGRNFNNPISIIIAGEEDLPPLVDDVPDCALKLIKAFWPGPLTIVFKASAQISPLLTAQTGKIGIRISSNASAMAIAKMLGRPLTATSANFAGAPECSTVSDVIRQIGDKIDVVFDGGKTAGGVGSTIIDVTARPPKILREGVISRREMDQCGIF